MKTEYSEDDLPLDPDLATTFLHWKQRCPDSAEGWVFVLAGQSKDEIHESIKAAVEKKELPPLEPDAMTFMLSKQGRLNDSAGHRLPYLMFYVPLKDAMTWGAGATDSPILVNPHFNGHKLIAGPAKRLKEWLLR